MKLSITGDKLKFHPRNVAEYFETGWANPISVQFQITNKCLFRCIYCDKILNNDETKIDDKIIDRLKSLGIKSIVLTGGEPLLYSKFSSDVPKLANNFKLGLVTTLCRYRDELEHNFEWIKVSLDSVDEKKYALIKGSNKLKKVLENLEKLYLKKDLKTKLGTQIVLTHQNKFESELVSFIERVYNICDYIQIRPVESIDPYEYSQDDLMLLFKLKEKYDKLIISEKFWVRERPIHCKARWTQLTIDIHHNVLLCCNRVHEIIANVHDEHLLDLLKSYQINFSKCYSPCVMSSNNYYLESLENGIHKEFL